MQMIYYKGLSIRPQLTEKLNLSNETILSYEIKKLKGWKSPNLQIVFKDKIFEIPIHLIQNYDEVLNYLKLI